METFVIILLIVGLILLSFINMRLEKKNNYLNKQLDEASELLKLATMLLLKTTDVPKEVKVSKPKSKK